MIIHNPFWVLIPRMDPLPGPSLRGPKSGRAHWLPTVINKKRAYSERANVFRAIFHVGNAENVSFGVFSGDISFTIQSGGYRQARM